MIRNAGHTDGTLLDYLRGKYVLRRAVSHGQAYQLDRSCRVLVEWLGVDPLLADLDADLLSAWVRHDVTTVGDTEIECYVLADGTRIVSTRGMSKALGRAWEGRKGGGKLPSFLGAANIKPFVSNDLLAVLNPIEFKARSSRAAGFRAELLPMVCEAYLKARDANALRSHQLHIAKQAEILMRGFARVGIVGSVLGLCCWFRGLVEKLVERPDVAGQPGHHGGRGPLLARFARMAGLPAEVVIGREHGERGGQVLQLLGEAQRQAVEPLDEQPLGAVESLNRASTVARKQGVGRRGQKWPSPMVLGADTPSMSVQSPRSGFQRRATVP